MSKGTKAVATIIGRMGDAVTVRSTQAGKKIGSIRLAVTSGYGDHELSSWFDVVVFDEKKVEVLEKYTGKGSRILVGGELRVRKWQDQSGNDRYSTECVVSFDGYIELLDSKAESKGNANAGGNYDREPSRSSGSGGGGGGGTGRPARPAFDDDLDDDVPF